VDPYSDDLRELGGVGEALEELRLEAPALFPGEDITRYSGGRWIWPTLQNKRSRREVPEDIFVYSGRRILIHRDRFFAWWTTNIRRSRPPMPGAFEKKRPVRRLHGKVAARG
jgi:hypothetical protein